MQPGDHTLLGLLSLPISGWCGGGWNILHILSTGVERLGGSVTNNINININICIKEKKKRCNYRFGVD